MSFYFIIKGTFDLILAFATRPVNDLWWLGLDRGRDRDHPRLLGRR